MDITIIALFIFAVLPAEIKMDQDGMEITDFVKNHGYPIETHLVETEDGYILTVYRIPSGKNQIPNKHPVLLNHALVVSAEIYVLLGPKKSLAFVLADNGYDVWLMNSRGVWHSRKHKNLTTNQKKYWNFSWHEIGTYDIPAVIDHILKVTSKTGVQYVGHSQGTTTLFVMGSERPEYNKKIKLMVALAPGARYKYAKNPYLRMIAPFYRLLEVLSDRWKLYEIPPPYLPVTGLRKLLKSMCLQSNKVTEICTLILRYISQIIDPDDLPNIINGIPSSFSVKQPLHYAQLIADGEFKQYNFGDKNNIKKYNSPDSPLYSLKNLTFPLALIWGANDEFVADEVINL